MRGSSCSYSIICTVNSVAMVFICQAVAIKKTAKLLRGTKFSVWMCLKCVVDVQLADRVAEPWAWHLRPRPLCCNYFRRRTMFNFLQPSGLVYVWTSRTFQAMSAHSSSYLRIMRAHISTTPCLAVGNAFNTRLRAVI